MQILVAGRRTGKTTESMMQCLELGLHLVVPTAQLCGSDK